MVDLSRQFRLEYSMTVMGMIIVGGLETLCPVQAANFFQRNCCVAGQANSRQDLRHAACEDRNKILKCKNGSPVKAH